MMRRKFVGICRSHTLIVFKNSLIYEICWKVKFISPFSSHRMELSSVLFMLCQWWCLLDLAWQSEIYLSISNGDLISVTWNMDSKDSWELSSIIESNWNAMPCIVITSKHPKSIKFTKKNYKIISPSQLLDIQRSSWKKLICKLISTLTISLLF